MVDDFTPFAQFHTFEQFANAFFGLLDRLTDATLVLAMHAPADASDLRIIEFVKAQMTGVIELEDDPASAAGTCTLVLRPGRFHSEGARAQRWTFSRPGRAAPSEAAIPPAPSPSRPGWDLSPVPVEYRVPTLVPETSPTPLVAAASADDDDVEGIRFFEFEEGPDLGDSAGGAPPPQPAGPDLPPPHDSDEAATPVTEPVWDLGSNPASDPFEYALTGEAEASAPPPDRPLFASLSTFLSEPVGLDFGASIPRREFVRAFEASRVVQEATAHPFLVLALHMQPDSPAADQFALVVRGMRVALGDAYVVFADDGRLRLVALLPGGGAGDAPDVFRRLKDFLHDVSPSAERTFRETSALLLPAGRPFHTAEAFLAYAFDT